MHNYTFCPDLHLLPSITELLLTSLRRTDLITLRTHSLKMFSLVLVHCAPPPTEVGVATVLAGESVCVTALKGMLDEDHLSDQEVGTLNNYIPIILL